MPDRNWRKKIRNGHTQMSHQIITLRDVQPRLLSQDDITSQPDIVHVRRDENGNRIRLSAYRGIISASIAEKETKQ